MTYPPLAAAGLAEAAFFFAALILLAGMILLAIGLVVTWRKRSRIGVILSIAACIGLGWLLQPWEAFGTHEGTDIDSPQYDPDAEYWVTRWRVLSGLWIGLTLGTIITGGRVIAPHGKPTGEQAGAGNEDHHGGF